LVSPWNFRPQRERWLALVRPLVHTRRMTGFLGNWLFPDAAPVVRQQRMQVVWFSVVLLLVLCTGMAVAFWLLNK